MIHFFYDSFLTFFRFLIPGIFLGVIYDIFCIIRIARNEDSYYLSKEIKKRYFSQQEKKTSSFNQVKCESVLVFIEDIGFFLIVAITEILSIYYFNEGKFRIYCLLFSGMGFLFYQKTVGRLIVYLSKKIITLSKKFLCICICLILKPVFYIMKKWAIPTRLWITLPKPACLAARFWRSSKWLTKS